MNKTLITALALASSLAVNAQHVSQTILVDFGDVKPGRSLPTEGADVNGNYWTNVKTSGNNYMYPGITFPVINTSNENTGYDILANTRFMSSGTGTALTVVSVDGRVLFSGRLAASRMCLPASAGVYLVNNMKVVVR